MRNGSSAELMSWVIIKAGVLNGHVRSAILHLSIAHTE